MEKPTATAMKQEKRRKKQLSKSEEECILSDLLNELKKSLRIAYPRFLCCTLTLIGIVKVQSVLEAALDVSCTLAAGGGGVLAVGELVGDR